MSRRHTAVLAAAVLAFAACGPALAESAPMAPADMALFHANMVRALEGIAGRTQMSWFNRATRHSGVIVAGASYKNAQGQSCRKFVHEYKAGSGPMHNYPGAACRAADGTWKVVE